MNRRARLTSLTKNGSSYPLVTNITMGNWKITIFNGKTHKKWQFSIAMLKYQRVMINNNNNNID